MNLTDETKQHLLEQRDAMVARLERRIAQLKTLDAEGFLRSEGLNGTASDPLLARLARAGWFYISYDAPNNYWLVSGASSRGTWEKKTNDAEIESVLNTPWVVP